MRIRLRSQWVGIPGILLAAALFGFAQQQASPPAQQPSTQTQQNSQALPATQAPTQSSQKKPPAPAGCCGVKAFPSRSSAPPAEVARGKQLFEANCSFCHGSDAMGGERGPELLLSQPLMDDRNGDIITPIVQHGFPPQMPSFSSLSDADIRAIAAFLHSLPLTNRGARSKLDIVVGNAQAGETYFHQHCTTCHSVSGTGPGNLAGIGSQYSPKTIQNFIVSGGKGRVPLGIPKPKIPPTTVTVTLGSGQTVKGKLDELSPFVVSLTESDGTYRTFLRHGTVPKVVVHDPLMWHIDMLPKWNDTEIHNLTAYLVTLK